MHGCTEGNFYLTLLQCIFILLKFIVPVIGFYDIHDGENVDGKMESSHKNGIQCVKLSIMEFRMNISKNWDCTLDQIAICTNVYEC